MWGNEKDPIEHIKEMGAVEELGSVEAVKKKHPPLLYCEFDSNKL